MPAVQHSSRTLNPVTPDWEGMLSNLRREGTPERIYYFEHGIAENVLTGLAERLGLWEDMAASGQALERRLSVHRYLGHELFRVFPQGGRMVAPKREGQWAEEGSGVVTSWKEFEAWNWQRPEDADYTEMEKLERLMPDNMRAFHVLDLWEVVRELVGFEELCYALYDDPDLVTAVFDKVSAFVETVARTLCDFESFGAIYVADDLGYKTGPMIDPEQIRRYVIPRHKRLAEIAHAKGKLFILHSCGNMYALMDDYIDELKIDAKHSFEDNVLPVTEIKKRYGERMTLLGGIDVDLLARKDEATIRRRTRDVLETCHPGGGYFLGSGNWVTDYIPLDSYLAMLDEARRFMQ